jgi:hypothetical protein
MNKFTARLIQEQDLEQCAGWIVDNPDIPAEDKRVLKYPTVLTLTIEKDGVPCLHIPLHMQMFIGFLGFNPEMDAKDKAHALRCAMQAAKQICKAFNVPEIHVATKAEYPIGRWAMKHGFNDSGKNDLYLEVCHL